MRRGPYDDDGAVYKVHVPDGGSHYSGQGVSREYSANGGEQPPPHNAGRTQFRLTAQLASGAIRELDNWTRMKPIIASLKEVITGDVPLAFFWIDISGCVPLVDLDDLFKFFHVTAYTEQQWRAMAIGSDGDAPSESTSSAGVESHEENCGNHNSATELDCLQAFVAEQYVQLHTTVLRSKKVVPCRPPSLGTGETLGEDEGSVKRPQHLGTPRVGLFGACESSAVTSVRLLCFRDGVVTWRPDPAIEGWNYLQQWLMRRVQETSCDRGKTDDCAPRRTVTTSQFVLAMLEELYVAFIPDTMVVNSEVDAIESMLPLVRQRQSDQADILRRVQFLRRNLCVQRRILMSKLSVLELLDRPTVRVLLPFMRPMLTLRTHPAQRHANSYAAIARHIIPALSKLEDARRILTNSIIIYSSGAAATNNYNSNKSDTLNVSLGYVALISVPPTIVASQWALEFHVPWRAGDTTVEFWSMVGVMGAYMLLVLVYPLYCWITGRPDRLVVR